MRGGADSSVCGFWTSAEGISLPVDINEENSTGRGVLLPRVRSKRPWQAALRRVRAMTDGIHPALRSGCRCRRASYRRQVRQPGAHESVMERPLVARNGHSFSHSCSDTRKLYSNFKFIRVRSFILNGAPFYDFERYRLLAFAIAAPGLQIEIVGQATDLAGSTLRRRFQAAHADRGSLGSSYRPNC
jgi:hypothetical protein